MVLRLEEVGGGGLAALDGEVGGHPVVHVLAADGQRVGEALGTVLGERERVDAGDLGDDGVRAEVVLGDQPQAYSPAETPMP